MNLRLRLATIDRENLKMLAESGLFLVLIYLCLIYLSPVIGEEAVTIVISSFLVFNVILSVGLFLHAVIIARRNSAILSVIRHVSHTERLDFDEQAYRIASFVRKLPGIPSSLDFLERLDMVTAPDPRLNKVIRMAAALV